MARKKLTQKQLDILYDCWKNADNAKDRLKLILVHLPNISSLYALSIMRNKAKTDPKWISTSTRKKNKIEKDKEQKKLEKEQKKLEKEQKKLEKKVKREERNKLKEEKTRLKEIKSKLKFEHLEQITQLIKSDFFFCSTVQHFVNNISCVYRVFSEDFNFPLHSNCEKCKKMDKYIENIEEVVNVQQKVRRNSSSTRNKDKEKSATTIKKDGRSKSEN
jgi:DNA gyrase/topoisomerase IV subunit A